MWILPSESWIRASSSTVWIPNISTLLQLRLPTNLVIELTSFRRWQRAYASDLSNNFMTWSCSPIPVLESLTAVSTISRSSSSSAGCVEWVTYWFCSSPTFLTRNVFCELLSDRSTLIISSCTGCLWTNMVCTMFSSCSAWCLLSLSLSWFSRVNYLMCFVKFRNALLIRLLFWTIWTS